MQISKLLFGAGCAAALILGGCSESGDDVPDTAEEGASVEETATAELTGKFLHLSDIHFNVFDSGMDKVVADLDVSDWKAAFENPANGVSSRPSSGRGNDSNYALLISALDAAAAAGNYDFILYTGDYLAHDFREKTDNSKAITKPEEFAAKTVEFVNLLLAEKFPNTKIVAALGNNDAGCGDYNLRRGGTFLKDLGPDMPNLPAASEKSFEESGFYSIAHPTVPGTDFLVMGTYWSEKFPQRWRGCDPTSDDPGKAQKDWLTKAVQPDAGSPDAKRPAILLMHIPPGIDGYSASKQWHSRFETDFEAVLPGATRPIVGGFAGHTHMDEFRVLSNANGPYLGVRVAPSVTTYNGNVPTFTIADYDSSDGRMTDYEVISYRGGSWQKEYRFSTAYGVSDYTPANLAKLAANMQDNDDTTGARATYRKFYSGRDTESASKTWQQVICATSFSEEADFWDCVGKVR